MRRERLVHSAEPRLGALGRYGYGAGVAFGVWSVFWPHPYGLVIALGVAIPLLVPALLKAGRDSLSVVGDPARVDIAPLLILPCLVMNIRGMFDIQTLDRTGPLVAGAILGAGLLGLVLWAEGGGKGWSPGRLARVLVFYGITSAWGYGSACLANGFLDHGPARRVETVVTWRSSSRRDPSVSLNTLTPPRETFRVQARSWEDFEQMGLGHIACLAEHNGLFGWRWVEVTACPSRRLGPASRR